MTLELPIRNVNRTVGHDPGPRGHEAILFLPLNCSLPLRSDREIRPKSAQAHVVIAPRSSLEGPAFALAGRGATLSSCYPRGYS